MIWPKPWAQQDQGVVEDSNAFRVVGACFSFALCGHLRPDRRGDRGMARSVSRLGIIDASRVWLAKTDLMLALLIVLGLLAIALCLTVDSLGKRLTYKQ